MPESVVSLTRVASVFPLPFIVADLISVVHLGRGLMCCHTATDIFQASWLLRPVPGGSWLRCSYAWLRQDFHPPNRGAIAPMRGHESPQPYPVVVRYTRG